LPAAAARGDLRGHRRHIGHRHHRELLRLRLVRAGDRRAHDAARVVGDMDHRAAFEAHQLGILDLDRLDVVEFGR